MDIRKIDEKVSKDVVSLITENWGAPIFVTRGKIHNADQLPGFIVLVGGRIAGLLTYIIDKEELEIVSLDSFIENQGIGSTLLDEAYKTAKKNGCKRIWMITTNDNVRAIRFYQKRGYDMKALYNHAIIESRKIKPEIPPYGNDDIPILHEIEFERVIVQT